MTMRRARIVLVLSILVLAATPARAGSSEEIARLFQEAASHESRGEWSLASSNYSKIIDKDPENPRAHFLLATSQVRIGMDDYAIKNFKEAIRLDPNLGEAREEIQADIKGEPGQLGQRTPIGGGACGIDQQFAR